MSIAELERNDPGKGYYSLNDKLWGHVVRRSEKCFERAEKTRALIKSKESLETYNEKMRRYFVESIGGLPYDSNIPLNSRITGVIEEENLTIEKVIFESRPNVYVTANLYMPKKRHNPCGAVLLQVGHAKSGKCAQQYQRVARCIASAGLIVMVMDPVGQGERLSYYEPELGQLMVPAATSDHQYAGEQCVLTGNSISRYFISDAMRAIDYLISRPEVDREKIGATGSSGGGTATCHLMMCDDRIKAAAPATFVTSRKAYLHAGGAQDSEQIWPGATEFGLDHHEFLLCFAPKPLLLLTVDTDFFPIEGTLEVMNSVKRFWAMYDAEEQLRIVTDKSQHKYTDVLASAAAEFFANTLNGEEYVADFAAMKSLPESDLWCTENGLVKLEFSDGKFVFDENIEHYRVIEKPKLSLREFLMEKMNFSRIEAPLNLRTFTPIYENGMKVVPYMWFSQMEMPNFGLMFSDFAKKPNDTVICLWDCGTDSIEEHIYEIREICKSGKFVLVLDVSGMGKCSPHPLNSGYPNKAKYGALDRLTKDLFFLGDSLCALRLFEIGYAIRMIKDNFGGNVSLYSEGISAAYARLWHEIEPAILINIKHGVPDYREIIENKYYENYNISCILIPGIAQYLKE